MDNILEIELENREDLIKYLSESEHEYTIIKFGPNKGNECNCKIKDNNSNYCGKHKNYSNKNIEKKMKIRIK